MPAFRKLIVPALTVAALLGSASLLTSGGAAVAADAAKEGVQWRTDVDAATAEAAETGRPLFMDFTAGWCPPCKQMEKDTWTDPRVQAMLNERFTPVKVDVDDNQKTAREHRVSSIPTLIVFDGDEPADRAVGYHGPDEMIKFLEAHAAEPADASAS